MPESPLPMWLSWLSVAQVAGLIPGKVHHWSFSLSISFFLLPLLSPKVNKNICGVFLIFKMNTWAHTSILIMNDCGLKILH